MFLSAPSLQDLINTQALQLISFDSFLSAVKRITQQNSSDHSSNYAVVMKDQWVIGILTEADIVATIAEKESLHLTVGEAQLTNPSFFAAKDYSDPFALLKYMHQQQIEFMVVLDDNGETILGVIERDYLSQIYYEMYQSTTDPQDAPFQHCLDCFQLLTENSIDVIMLHSLEGVNLYVSPSCRGLFGYEPSELVGRSAYDFFHPDDLEYTRFSHEFILENQDPFTVVYRFLCKNGSYVWVETNSKVINELCSGEPPKILSLTRDISDRIQNQIELERVYREKGFILDSITEACFAVNQEWEIMYCNHQFICTVEIRREDLVGRNLWECFPDAINTIFCYTYHYCMDHRTPQVFEGYYDPFQSWYEVHAYPIEDGGLSVFFRDITEQKRASQLQMNQLEQAQILNQINQGIRHSQNLDLLLSTIVTDIRKLFDVDQALIFSFKDSSRRDIHSESFSQVEFSLSSEGINTFSIEETCYNDLQHGNVICIDDSCSDQSPPCQITNDLRIRSELVVPIFIGEKLWGGITLHHCTRAHHWSSSSIDLIIQIAEHVGIAVQQALLLKELQSANEELLYQVEVRNSQLRQMVDYEELLRLISDEVRSSLDETQILESVVHEVSLGLQLYRCNIAVLTLDRSQYIVMHEATTSTSTKGREVLVEPNILEQMERGESVLFSTDHPLWGRQSILVCPLFPSQQLIGFLLAFRPPSQGFERLEIRLIEQIANQCSIAVRQARLYRSVQDQIEKLRELNQVKEDFLNLVSHELRTPLTTMKVALAMLKQTNPNARQSKYLNILEYEWNKELNIVNDLLDLQRLESGSKTLKIDSVHVQSWLQELLEPFRLRCQEQELTLNCQCPEQMTEITTDSHLLTRIVSELINNALKYTPRQEQISIEVELVADQLVIRVSNTGVEIPPEHLPKIFEKFHRVTALDRSNQGGTGLGLPLARKAAELLGAQLQVVSQSQVTCFTVQIPACL